MLLLVTAGLWRAGRLRGAALQLVLAVLLVGAAGYALQGRPWLPGAPKDASQRAAPLPLTAARQAMLGQFNQSGRWLTIADSFAARGKTEDAVGVVRAGLRQHPNDAGLWVGLGNALVDHAGMLTPAAEFAYTRARRLAPRHPAPLFFRGLALARSGQREEALSLWRQALALTPPGTPYRPMIEGGMAVLEGGVSGVQPTTGAPPAER
jgi:cytochrome c-type biogenesis protein CcmH/NrfG